MHNKPVRQRGTRELIYPISLCSTVTVRDGNGAANPVERRLAAILAADVAGYSRLMGLDEVGTAQVLREHRGVVDALVAKHGGRIVKTTGDGLLIEFHSVVDAVECALAIQAVMADRNEGVPADR